MNKTTWNRLWRAQPKDIIDSRVIKPSFLSKKTRNSKKQKVLPVFFFLSISPVTGSLQAFAILSLTFWPADIVAELNWLTDPSDIESKPLLLSACKSLCIYINVVCVCLFHFWSLWYMHTHTITELWKYVFVSTMDGHSLCWCCAPSARCCSNVPLATSRSGLSISLEVLNFFTAFHEKGHLITDLTSIAWNYMFLGFEDE